MAPMIQVQGLAKRFGDVQAVREVDFEIPAGEIFGFLGPNGAGKTTTINMLTGLARPDAGRIYINGVDCVKNNRAAQHLIGVVPDDSNLYPELSGRDNLEFCGALYGLSRVKRRRQAARLLSEFGLEAAADRKFAHYSRGMKRKLTIAAAVVHDPALIFLDEPTTGLDVASSRQLRRAITRLNEQGTTLFLTTHYIEEAERLCNRIAFIVDGRIVRTDTLARLLEPVQDRHAVRFQCADLTETGFQALIRQFPDLTFRRPGPDTLRMESGAPVRVAPLIRALEAAGVEVYEAVKIRPGLEEVFVRLTGLEAGDMKEEAAA